MSGADYRIAHLFADHGTEGEVLARFGEIERYTINPRPNPFVNKTVKIDLMSETPDTRVDLALLHPKCTDKSNMTSISGDPDDHENQIPRAREIAHEIADHYVIENRPRDDLEDPVVLTGKMFGLPIKYERAFEASFSIKAPPRYQELPTECSPYFYSDRSADWWRAVKGYAGDYSKEHLSKNALPVPYVLTLVRSWLKEVNERDAAPDQNNNGPAPQKLPEDQATLTATLESGGEQR